MTILQEYFLTQAGPFDMTIDDLRVICAANRHYYFDPQTVKAFKARFPRNPILLNGFAYVYETQAAGPKPADGRKINIVQVRLSDCYVRRVFSTQSKKAANAEWAAIEQAAKGERGFYHYGASAEFHAETEKGGQLCWNVF